MQYWKTHFNYFHYDFGVMWCNHPKDGQDVPFTFPQHNITIIIYPNVSTTRPYFLLPSLLFPYRLLHESFLPSFFANPSCFFFLSFFSFFSPLILFTYFAQLQMIDCTTHFPIYVTYFLFHIFPNMHHIYNIHILYECTMNVCPLSSYHYGEVYQHQCWETNICFHLCSFCVFCHVIVSVPMPHSLIDPPSSSLHYFV